jgi:uncharacterized protein (TIGR02147 family)
VFVHKVFAYLDYRAFLRETHEELQAEDPSVSLRAFAARFPIDPGQLVRILKGKNHLSAKFVPVVAQIAGMDDRAAAYFEELLHLAASQELEEQERSRERLLALRGVATRSLVASQAEYYTHWQHSIVRALLGLGPYLGSPGELGQLSLPTLLGQEVETSLCLLTQLGLVIQDDTGAWRLTDDHLVPGADVPVQTLRGLHLQMMDLAQSALERIPPAQRDFSALTLSLDASGLERIRELSRDLRRRIQTLVESTTQADHIYQLNLQAFPVAILTEGVAA